MKPLSSLLKLSGKTLVGLVYVGIALTVVGQAALSAAGQFHWFDSATSLEVNVESVSLQTNSQIIGYPYANVVASVVNPTGFSGLETRAITYNVFVNSTTEDFQVRGSSQVAMSSVSKDLLIPPKGSVDITYQVRISDFVVPYLQSFLDAHPNDLKTFVEVILYLQSPFGIFDISYCYDKSGTLLLFCPPTRAAPTSGGGGA